MNIFGITYKIRQDKDEYLEANSILGEILYHDQEIYIKSVLSADRKLKIMVHEIAHGILFEVGAVKAAGDESIIHLLSICLHQFMTSNEDLFTVAKEASANV